MSDGSDSADIKLSVTELVQFSARSGDLFHEELLGPDAQEGQRGHKQIQKSRDPEWLAEHAVRYDTKVNELSISLGGRIDLLNTSSSPPIIEEIKTCYGPGHLLPPERKAIHWAQLKVYGALFSLAQDYAGLQKLIIRITYYDLLSKQIYSEDEEISSEHCIAYCQQLLEIYCTWWRALQAKKQQALEASKALKFPYKQYRPGQRELAIEVFRKLRDSDALLIEAPTGTGKTLSVLFPALKAYSEKYTQQILYLTPKGSAQHNALDALEQLKLGDKLDVLVLQAKDKACPCLSSDPAINKQCQSERGICNRTIGFYDRLPAAREEALHLSKLTPAALQSLAQKHELCPFELSIQLVGWFSLVIADVNYVYDPLVRLAFLEQAQKSRVVLIDEVHNLPARARDMYSGELDAALCQQVARALPSAFKGLAKPLARLSRQINSIDEHPFENEKDGSPLIPQSLHHCLYELLAQLQKTGDKGFAGGLIGENASSLRHWVKQLYRFIAIAQLKSSAHGFIVDKNEAGNNLKLRCVDGSAYLRALHTKVKSLVGFSATLQPIAFSRQQIGLDENTAVAHIPCWFPPENQLSLCTNFISTHWDKREQSLQALVELIYIYSSTKPGNYLIFFPSFAYLKMTYECFRESHPEIEVMLQQDKLDDEERQAFINNFKANSPQLAFAILGGIFSEAVDYPGDSLIGCMIIGTGMPQPSEEQKLMADYFAKCGKNPYQYAYQFPGFIRLMQTAGRVIRSEKDKGVVLFVEPRLGRSDYKKLLPEGWGLQFCSSANAVKEKLEDFWATGA
ncbi:Rad3-related DNA helicase [Alteromonadaceae bacterium Bs31]|nr:Rad3-related DNA helicase [Alteromonadaceae bacterium Bs31]